MVSITRSNQNDPNHANLNQVSSKNEEPSYYKNAFCVHFVTAMSSLCYLLSQSTETSSTLLSMYGLSACLKAGRSVVFVWPNVIPWRYREFSQQLLSFRGLTVKAKYRGGAMGRDWNKQWCSRKGHGIFWWICSSSRKPGQSTAAEGLGTSGGSPLSHHRWHLGSLGLFSFLLCSFLWLL